MNTENPLQEYLDFRIDELFDRLMELWDKSAEADMIRDSFPEPNTILDTKANGAFYAFEEARLEYERLYDVRGGVRKPLSRDFSAAASFSKRAARILR